MKTYKDYFPIFANFFLSIDSSRVPQISHPLKKPLIRDQGHSADPITCDPPHAARQISPLICGHRKAKERINVQF